MSAGVRRWVFIAAVYGALASAFIATTDGSHAADYYLRFPWAFGDQAYITQGYNGYSHQNQDYYAIDFQIEGGSTQAPVVSTTFGAVVGRVTGSYCHVTQGYGNYVDVKSATPPGAIRYARYGHLSSVNVSVGQTLFQGQTVGQQGNTGWVEPCTGVHLHFRWTSSQSCGSQSCAVEPEPMSGQTGFAAGQTKTSDNTALGEGDVATFFDYGSGNSRIHTWMEDGGEFGYYDSDGWWKETQGGYSLSRVGSRMVMGDFDGDGLNDVATMYDYDGGEMNIHVWLADPDNPTQTQRFNYQGGGGWYHTDGVYEPAQVAGRFVTGNFNGDAYDDVAAFYDYGSGVVRIHVWLSNGGGFDLSGGSGGWWYTLGPYYLSNIADRVVAGDFDEDGYDDVAAFYRYSSTDSRIHVWLSSGSSFNYQNPNNGWWSPGTGQSYDAAQVAGRFVAGDFDSDEDVDVATFYNYGSGSARIHVWLSNGSSAFNWNPPVNPHLGWWNTPSGYNLSFVGDRFVSADFDADTYDDVATFFDYGSGAARIHVWLSTGSAFGSYDADGWWKVLSGYQLGNVSGRMVAGDFDGR